MQVALLGLRKSKRIPTVPAWMVIVKYTLVKIYIYIYICKFSFWCGASFSYGYVVILSVPQFYPKYDCFDGFGYFDTSRSEL